MTNPRVAVQQNRSTDEQGPITRVTVAKLFVIIAAVGFILRIFYSGHLYEDDGLWFTAGEEIVRGKSLYREIYFDKPPGLALVYAFLFWIFGAHVITIRLFTIGYSIAISGVLYLFGSRFYDKRVGLLAAALFAVFSTTYTTGHVQGLGTDFLMALPYTAGAYLLVRSVRDRTHRARLAIAGGVLVGVAFQINPKGIFDLFFFALLLLTWRWSARHAGKLNESNEIDDNKTEAPRLWLLSLAVFGLVIGSLPFLLYIGATRSLPEYWSYVWVWGVRYGSYNPLSEVFVPGLTRTIDYFALNNTLLIALAIVCVITVRQATQRIQSKVSAAGNSDPRWFLADSTLLLWLIVSYVGVVLGGRLYSHYFFQILPSLCLIGARGITEIKRILKSRDAGFRSGVIAILLLGFAFTVVRFHGRTVVLAADVLRGRKSKMTSGWFHERTDREERKIAALVRGLSDGEDDSAHFGTETIRDGGPRMREPQGQTDYLFVWGYRPEIYYFSGLLPASRYLSTQPLTGVPADVHYFDEDDRPVLDEATTASAREQLITDLQETRPKYIVDELGMFNAGLSINSYPEMKEFMKEYKPIGPVERFMIYSRQDIREKRLRRMEEKGR